MFFFSFFFSFSCSFLFPFLSSFLFLYLLLFFGVPLALIVIVMIRAFFFKRETTKTAFLLSPFFSFLYLLSFIFPFFSFFSFFLFFPFLFFHSFIFSFLLPLAQLQDPTGPHSNSNYKILLF